FFWIISGQPILGLYSYFLSSAAIISGYTEAMSLYGNKWYVVYYLIATFILLSSLYYEKEIFSKKLKLIIFLTFSFYLFVAFKGGFVRHDGHALISASAILIAALFFSFI